MLAGCIVNTDLFDQILGVGQFPVVQVQVPLRGRNVGVPQQSPGVFDPLRPADLRPAFVAGQVQNQIPRKTGHVPEPGIRPAEIRNAPRFPDRGQENWPGWTFPDGLREQLPQLPALCGQDGYVALA